MNRNSKGKRRVPLVWLLAVLFALTAVACHSEPDGGGVPIKVNEAEGNQADGNKAQSNETAPKVSIQSFAAFTAPNIPETYRVAPIACNLVYDGGTLYQLNGTEVNIIDADDMTLRRTIQLEGLDEYKIEPGFAYADGALYVMRNNYGQRNGTHWEVTPAAHVTYLDTYDMDGKLLDRIDLLENIGRATELLVQDGKAFILAGNNGQYRVYRVDLETRTLQKLDFTDITGMTTGGAGRVFLYHDLQSRSELLVYDTRQNAVTETIDLGADGSPLLCFDEATDRLYIYSGGALFRMDMAAKTTEKLYSFIDSAAVNMTYKLRMAGGRLVVFSMDGACKVLSDLDNSWESDVMLTFLSPNKHVENSFVNEAFVAFNELYPNFQYRVVHVEYENYQAELAKKLMAKDTDFDLYITDAQFEPGAIRADYFEDLSQYPAIVENFDAMLPGLRALSSADGKIVGVPYSINVRALGYNKNVFDHYGIQTPAPLLTLADYAACFAEAAPALAADKVSVGEMQFVMLFDMFASNFFNGAVTPTAADLSALLDTCRQLVSQNVLAVEWENGLFTDLPTVPFAFGENAMSYPRYNDTAQYPLAYRMLSVNENSANKALAVEYLTILSSQNTQDSVIQKRVEAEKFFNEDLADVLPVSIEQSMNFPYLYASDLMHSNENYRMYTQILANSIRQGVNMNAYATDTFTQYVNGEITLDSATERIYSRLTMIRDE